jgi:hypothetical protein
MESHCGVDDEHVIISREDLDTINEVLEEIEIIDEEEMSTIELDISDELLFKLMKEAHEQDITLNELIADILEEAIEELEEEDEFVEAEEVEEVPEVETPNPNFCAYCLGDADIKTQLNEQPDETYTKTFYVKCVECNARCSDCESTDEAIALWNSIEIK